MTKEIQPWVDTTVGGGMDSAIDSAIDSAETRDREKWLPLDWDKHWMGQALALAEKAAQLGEVPVGAVVVRDNVLVGEGFNQPILSADPTAHAEVVALRAAAKTLNNYRLPGATLYVTLEPCSMCAGAMVHGRISRLVFAAFEPKAGVVQSQESFFERAYLNHRVEVLGGVASETSSKLLSHFFQQRREQKKTEKQKPNNDLDIDV